MILINFTLILCQLNDNDKKKKNIIMTVHWLISKAKVFLELIYMCFYCNLKIIYKIFIVTNNKKKLCKLTKKASA